MSKTITFGCVAYNNPQDIKSWISSVNGIDKVGYSLKLVISDNSTDVCSSEAIKDICRNAGAIYLSDGRNSGFFSGLNRVLSESRVDLYVLGNPDVKFGRDFLIKLNEVGFNKDVAVLAPDIVEGARHLNPYIVNEPNYFERSVVYFKYFSFFLYCGVLFLERIGLVQVLIRLFGNQLSRNSVKVQSVVDREIWSAHGSCFILTGEFIKKCQKLPDQSFLWFEEVMLSELVRAKGLKVVFASELNVIHDGHSTTGSIDRYNRFRIKSDSAKRYFKYRRGLKL